MAFVVRSGTEWLTLDREPSLFPWWSININLATIFATYSEAQQVANTARRQTFTIYQVNVKNTENAKLYYNADDTVSLE